MITNSKIKAIFYDWKFNHKKNYRFTIFLLFAFVFCGVFIGATTIIRDTGTSTFGSDVNISNNSLYVGNLYFGSTLGD